MKTIDVNSNSYPEYNVDSNDKDPKLKIGYYVRISKYKNICHYVKTFLIGQKKFSYTENKNSVPWTYVIIDLNGEKIVGTFYEK